LSPTRADDAVQQAFVNAYAALRGTDADIRLRPWLYRIAHNASLNVLRAAGPDHVPVDEQIDGVETPPQALERSERLRSVVTAVRELPDRQRDALVLQALEGRSYEEIALELGVTDGAVRQLLNRARTTLREGATALTPPALAARIGTAANAPVADRVAQAVAGAGGGAALAKGIAVVAVTGAFVGGAAERILPGGNDGSHHKAPAVAAAGAGPGSDGSSGSGRPSASGLGPSGTHVRRRGAAGRSLSGGRASAGHGRPSSRGATQRGGGSHRSHDGRGGSSGRGDGGAQSNDGGSSGRDHSGTGGDGSGGEGSGSSGSGDALALGSHEGPGSGSTSSGSGSGDSGLGSSGGGSGSSDGSGSDGKSGSDSSDGGLSSGDGLSGESH
jgi:RNA polymerase sigma factor (sigma-70 family)